MADPTTDQLAQVRALLGSPTTSLVSDATITALWALSGDTVFETAALVADSLSAKYASSVTFSVEGLSIQNSQKASAWRAVADGLRARGQAGDGSIGLPSVFGISLGDMGGVETDDDRFPTRAHFGQDDNPGLPVPNLLGDQQ
jgi:hypothetical protein